MLIKEKINQAKEILKEFDIDCWLTFVRGKFNQWRSRVVISG